MLPNEASASAPENQSLKRFPMPVWFDADCLFHGGQDRGFDEFLNLPEDDQRRLPAWLDPIISGTRKRQRSAAGKCHFQKTLGCVVANAIVASEGGWATRVHYSRREDAYVGESVYKPDWLYSNQLIKIIDALGSAGLLALVTAKPAPPGVNPQRSTYRLTKGFRDDLIARGFLAPTAIHDTSLAPVVILRDQAKRLAPYSEDDRAEEIATVRAINAFIGAQRFDLKLPAGVILKRRPNMRAKWLRRIYNINFERGGRFYGGWWQGQPKEVRRFITINGEPTIELDYSSMHPRMLYHEAGIDYPGDPYDVPEIKKACALAGMPWKQGREIVKSLLPAILNARQLKGLWSIKECRALPKTIRPVDALRAIQKHNEQIADRMFTGVGPLLMKKESDICAEVLHRAMDEGIPILSIHDSFIVQATNSEWLRNTMMTSYHNTLGRNPSVK